MNSTSTVNDKTRNHKRRCYVINAAFQWKYALTLTIGVFLVASAMGVTLFGMLHEQARFHVLHPEVVNVWQNTRVVFLFALAFSAVVVVSLLCWGIMITHRVSGPLFVLDRGLRELTAGRIPTRRPLRKKDEFKELYNTFWTCVDSLVAQRKAEADKVAKLIARAQGASANCTGDEKDTLTHMAREMAQMRDEMEAYLCEQKAPPPNAAAPSTVAEKTQTNEPAECGV